jgi:hypothetical protein
MKKVETALDRFKVEEEKIRAVVADGEKHYDRVIEEQTKIRDKAKIERLKAAAIVADMTADFEKIEADLEAEEVKRLDASGLTKAALDAGRIGAAEYYKQGLTAGEITTKAAAVASEKLADLKTAIRAKALRLIELEAAELDADYNIAFAMQAPAASFREKLAALLKSLEANLASPWGIGGEPGIKSLRDSKMRELRYAKQGRLPGEGSGWTSCDLAGLKRLRLDPLFPADQLGRLDEIIAEAKATGRGVRLQIDPRDRKNPIGLMWV